MPCYVKEFPIVIISQVIGRNDKAQCASLEARKLIPKRVHIRDPIRRTVTGNGIPSAIGNSRLGKSVRAAHRKGGLWSLSQGRAGGLRQGMDHAYDKTQGQQGGFPVHTRNELTYDKVLLSHALQELLPNPKHPLA